MLPRPVVVGIVILLTLMEAVNLIGEVFLGTGADAFHFVYPTVLAALGFTSKGKVEPFPHQLLGGDDDEDDGGWVDPDADTEPTGPHPGPRPRHRQPPRGRDR